MNSPSPPIGKLILVPSLVTLGVTALRLVGELVGWNPRLFSREPGGAGALIGIVWLVPVFGIYFALELRRLGFTPAAAGRALGYAALGLMALPAVAVAIGKLVPGFYGSLAGIAIGSAPAIWLTWRGWPALARTLAFYGVAARAPVVVVMALAIFGDWGTHYDGPPPNFPAGHGPGAELVLTGLIPQLTVWIAFTVVVGALFGAFAVIVSGWLGRANR